MPSLLITGGAGYIGSHTFVELAQAGYTSIILDNFSNSSPTVLQRLEELVGSPVKAVHGDIRDPTLLDKVFQDARTSGSPISAVVHFAGLKSVRESVSNPFPYYETNVYGTLQLLRAMDRAKVTQIIFSSSATVYGAPHTPPYAEGHPIAPTNPYGHSKAMAEQILRDWSSCSPERRAISLRYFNPIGAHPSGRIGEAPQGTPENLFPFITQVAVGKLQALSIFGNDYSTPDGSGIRDYLHVTDLACGHVKAIEYARQAVFSFLPINLGTGRGTSVVELKRAFEQTTGIQIPFEVKPRRPGDIAAVWADSQIANKLLGWTATRSIADMCADGWRWQMQNPSGYPLFP